MSDFLAHGWQQIDCTDAPVHLSLTLSSGQAFRWIQIHDGLWAGSILDLGVLLWQAPDSPSSPIFWKSWPDPEGEQRIRNYLQLDVDLMALYSEWIAADPRIEPATTAYEGLRILRQPPIECLFAFLCATAKPVPMIEQLVRRLAELLGDALPLTPASNILDQSAALPDRLPSYLHISQPVHQFPTLEQLAAQSEAFYRSLGWGFRGPRVHRNAQILLTQKKGWLETLRVASYEEARNNLLQMEGIGPKVADCICLFSLDKPMAVPIDRHVWRIGCELYLPELTGQNLTNSRYAQIQACFEERFGGYAGWAQQYLFFSRLRRAREYSDEGADRTKK